MRFRFVLYVIMFGRMVFLDGSEIGSKKRCKQPRQSQWDLQREYCLKKGQAFVSFQRSELGKTSGAVEVYVHKRIFWCCSRRSKEPLKLFEGDDYPHPLNFSCTVKTRAVEANILRRYEDAKNGLRIQVIEADNGQKLQVFVRR